MIEDVVRIAPLAACEIAGVEPAFVTYADGDPDGYALAVNINRRHLKASARHLIAEMARRLTDRTKLSVSSESERHRLAEAGVILDFAPDLVEKVFAGGMTLQQAAEIARARKREAAETRTKMERLRVDAIDLYEHGQAVPELPCFFGKCREILTKCSEA